MAGRRPRPTTSNVNVAWSGQSIANQIVTETQSAVLDV
jgi:hypothetical protein